MGNSTSNDRNLERRVTFASDETSIDRGYNYHGRVYNKNDTRFKNKNALQQRSPYGLNRHRSLSLESLQEESETDYEPFDSKTPREGTGVSLGQQIRDKARQQDEYDQQEHKQPRQYNSNNTHGVNDNTINNNRAAKSGPLLTPEDIQGNDDLGRLMIDRDPRYSKNDTRGLHRHYNDLEDQNEKHESGSTVSKASRSQEKQNTYDDGYDSRVRRNQQQPRDVRFTLHNAELDGSRNRFGNDIAHQVYDVPKSPTSHSKQHKEERDHSPSPTTQQRLTHRYISKPKMSLDLWEDPKERSNSRISESDAFDEIEQHNHLSNNSQLSYSNNSDIEKRKRRKQKPSKPRQISDERIIFRDRILGGFNKPSYFHQNRSPQTITERRSLPDDRDSLVTDPVSVISEGTVGRYGSRRRWSRRNRGIINDQDVNAYQLLGHGFSPTHSYFSRNIAVTVIKSPRRTQNLD